LALKAEAEEIRDKSDRIVRLILAAKMERLLVHESEDVDIPVTPTMRQQWSHKIEELQAEIKGIVGGW